MAVLGAIAVTGLAAGAALASGCGSSDDTATGSSTARSAAGTGLIRECDGGKASTPSVVNLENRLDVPVSLLFSQVDCTDWTGRSPKSRTPVFYSPVNLRAGSAMPDGVAGVSIAVDNAARLGRRPWTATVQTSGGQVVARFRLALTRFGNYGNEQMKLGMWNAERQTFSREPDTFTVLPAALVGGRPAKAVIGAGNTLVLRYDK